MFLSLRFDRTKKMFLAIFENKIIIINKLIYYLAILLLEFIDIFVHKILFFKETKVDFMSEF